MLACVSLIVCRLVLRNWQASTITTAVAPVVATPTAASNFLTTAVATNTPAFQIEVIATPKLETKQVLVAAPPAPPPGVGTGAIVGAVIGGVIGFVLIVCLIMLMGRRDKPKKKATYPA